MEITEVDSAREPFSVSFRPSVEGGKFIVNDSEYLDNFVGIVATVYGFTEEDIAKLRSGDTSPIANYLRPVNEVPGTVEASEIVVDLVVSANRHGLPVMFTGVQRFQEVAPYRLVE